MCNPSFMGMIFITQGVSPHLSRPWFTSDVDPVVPNPFITFLKCSLDRHMLYWLATRGLSQTNTTAQGVLGARLLVTAACHDRQATQPRKPGVHIAVTGNKYLDQPSGWTLALQVLSLMSKCIFPQPQVVLVYDEPCTQPWKCMLNTIHGNVRARKKES